MDTTQEIPWWQKLFIAVDPLDYATYQTAQTATVTGSLSSALDVEAQAISGAAQQDFSTYVVQPIDSIIPSTSTFTSWLVLLVILGIVGLLLAGKVEQL